MTCPLIKVSL